MLYFLYTKITWQACKTFFIIYYLCRSFCMKYFFRCQNFKFFTCFCIMLEKTKVKKLYCSILCISLNFFNAHFIINLVKIFFMWFPNLKVHLRLCVLNLICALFFLIRYIYIYSFKNLFCKLSFGQRPRQCLNKSYSNRILFDSIWIRFI